MVHGHLALKEDKQCLAAEAQHHMCMVHVCFLTWCCRNVLNTHGMCTGGMNLAPETSTYTLV